MKCQQYVLKYEVVVDLVDGIICWVWGGLAGSVGDLTIARSNLLKFLLPGEKLFADKGYRGEDAFLIPHQGRWEDLTPAQQEWNKLHTNVHFQHIERVNNRLKIWDCLTKEWRHPLEKHHIAFFVIANLTNLELVFHPLNK